MEVNQDSQKYNAKTLSIIALQSAVKNVCRIWISLKIKSNINAKDHSSERQTLISYHEPHRIILSRSIPSAFYEFQALTRCQLNTFFKNYSVENDHLKSELRFMLWLCFENIECQRLIIEAYEVRSMYNNLI